jgi:hypothetical protein
MQLQRSVQPDDWDAKRSRLKGRTVEAREFNEYIDAVLTRTRQRYSELITMHDVVTPAMVRDAVLGVNTAKPKMIIEIWEEHIEGLRKLIGKESTVATCQKYNAAKNHFANYLKQYYKTSDVPIKSVDHFMITQFAMYLKTEKGCNFNTATNGYGELALLYFPNSTKKSASTQLGRWVRHNENLKNRLVECGYKPRKKILTPIQVRIFIDILGEP